MSIDNKNILNLNLKKEEKILDFSDFQKQNIKFDIARLQEAYTRLFKLKNLRQVWLIKQSRPLLAR